MHSVINALNETKTAKSHCILCELSIKRVYFIS